MLDNLIKEFEDTIEVNKVFSYFDFEVVKEELLSTRSRIVFLLGDPGSGKSFMLNFLYSKFPNRYVLLKEPFFSKDEFFERAGDIKNKTILIDEAQLLNEEMVEFLRILSDKGNQIILAMHKKEGERIINLPQFKSRYTQKIFLHNLTYDEFERFVLGRFINQNKQGLINKKILKKMYRLTKGNFRLSKKIVFTALDLLNFSIRNGLKYNKIDSCIFEMSAIKIGLK